MTEDEKIKIELDFNRALQIWHEGKSLEAIQILKNLDKKFPNQAAILGVIGGIYFSLRDWENSYIYYKKTARLAPKSETASIALFHCLFELEKYDESFDEIKRFISISQKFDLKLKEYNLLLSDWKRDLNLKTDDYFEIAEAFFRDFKAFLKN